VTNLLEHVENSIHGRKLLRSGGRVLVAVSGGLDSMVLLHVLHLLAERNRWRLFVVHFNHQLRGRSSDADERFVARAAARFGLRFLAGRGAVRRLAQKRGVSIEMAARELRHEFLARAAQRLKSRSIVLAHHADDQVELFFLRLMRGAGGEGLAGMKWTSPSPGNGEIRLVRPLLDVTRADLELFAREGRIRFREDATNASRAILRNRIRHELLPLLRRRFQPALDRNLLRAMDIVGAETDAVDALARAWLAIRRPAFARLAIAVERRVLQFQLRQLNLREEFDLVESLRISPGRPITVRPGVAVERDLAGRVFIRSVTRQAFQPGRLGLDLVGRTGEAAFAGMQLRWRVIARTGARFRVGFRREQFDADKVGRQIVLRHWQPGDRFQPIGLPASVKLQDWFTNQKVPRQERRNLLVAVTAAGEVFWIENQRIGERFKLGAATKRRLLWTWRRG
jgi:tRNA(Ile)-lysidine synthase